ncbi:TetR/AcrR family transcriptional regulator [Bradyrhizobium sp. CCGUVB23]|uniref:TetR/AcrR family transcriptional regulator n=1 Tax=Bradyrhizobium sp. CCGUVB23 TaxID=2949630 RepID=UPI0020B2A664|nr:TetR/AcrR family transcriptional regulator [Bradyrhizobium sp. CCGUVB23]MCP3462070.1 TetR/AcrR family transcriptional regulator [Bradyrhizobium sp. CCGUVB23]
MADQLSAGDWVDLGLKTLAKSGFTALKADPLAKAMGVSRGSFYWHFADLAAFHAAILSRWREVATEQIIAAVEAAKNENKRENTSENLGDSGGQDPLAVLLKLTFGSKLMLEKAVRSWAANDARARAAVVAVDRRRLDYIESLLKQAGLTEEVARPRAQILFWAFFGFALSDQTLPADKQQAALDELRRIVAR